MATVSIRHFLGRREESDVALAQLSPNAQAALRQFSADRLRGYGVAQADVVCAGR